MENDDEEEIEMSVDKKKKKHKRKPQKKKSEKKMNEILLKVELSDDDGQIIRIEYKNSEGVTEVY